MEHYFAIAGAVVKVSGAEDELFTDAGVLEAFRISPQPWDYEIRCALTDKIPAPEGKQIYADPGKLVFDFQGDSISWIGPVQKSFADAHIWVRRQRCIITALFQRSVMGSRIRVSALLKAVEPEHIAIQKDGFLLHGACICHQGKALVFTAPSGTGKSTQAELWRIHRGAAVINGDRIMLRLGANGWEAVGIPFCGSSGIRENRTLPLAALICLSQAPVSTVSPLGGFTAFRRIWEGCTLQTWNRQDVEHCTDLVQKLIDTTPILHLACRPDLSAVETLEAALNR